MDTIKITKAMVDGLSRPKEAGYQKNFQPTVPIADIEIQGESMKLKMDCFSKHGNVGNISFEIVDNDVITASGNAEFLLDKEEINKIEFHGAFKGSGMADIFVRKCILLLNEFNYIEWQNKVRRTGGKAGKTGKPVNAEAAGRKYHIDPVFEAADFENTLTETELMDMLRKEEKAFSAEKRQVLQTSGKPGTGRERTENEAPNIESETVLENIKSYIRRTAAWYVRGHYDHHGHYHPFYFAKSKIPVGHNYSAYRVLAD